MIDFDYEVKKVGFKPKARLILQLGARLIANEKIAISEIVKNSYDACARKEFATDLQHSIANHVSRIGISSLDL